MNSTTSQVDRRPGHCGGTLHNDQCGCDFTLLARTYYPLGEEGTQRVERLISAGLAKEAYLYVRGVLTVDETDDLLA
ncbi:MAG: hypothetical protein R3324_14200 [Halobacteriales archaeon]|nr:hypothetical protein [Halobacteriales archaeon]